MPIGKHKLKKTFNKISYDNKDLLKDNQDIEDNDEEDKHFNQAKVDSIYKCNSKSAHVLLTKSKIQLENCVQIEEEIRFNLPESSDFILDESEKFYRHKTQEEKELSEERIKALNKAQGLSNAFRSKTANFINSNLSKDEKKKSIMFSTVKVIYEYSDDEIEDYNDYCKRKGIASSQSVSSFGSKSSKSSKGSKGSNKKNKKKKYKNEKFVSKVESDDDGLSEKELERLKEAKRKRNEAKVEAESTITSSSTNKI